MIGIEMFTSTKLTVVFVLIGLHGHSSEKVPKEELGEFHFPTLGLVFFSKTYLGFVLLRLIVVSSCWFQGQHWWNRGGGAQNVLNFTHFFGKVGKIRCWRHLQGCASSYRETLFLSLCPQPQHVFENEIKRDLR